MAQTKSKGFVQKSRDRIKAGRVLPRLIECYNGELELNQQQVTIGLALLKKVLPDTSHQILEANLDNVADRDKTLSELYRDVLDSEKG